MKNNLRIAVESMKQHYIQKLIDAGVYQASDDSLQSLTLTELEALFTQMEHGHEGTPSRRRSDVIL
jgi:hypothetical protein